MRRLLLPLLMVLCAGSAANAQTVAFTTEEYAPFSYRENDVIKGANVDQVRKLMTGLGVDYTIDLMPWARAYAQAQTTPMSCVIGTAHNPERDPLFKWVEPLLIDRTILITHTGNGVNANTLQDAKPYSVGTWRGDNTETLLRHLQFPKIDVATDFKATLKKLMSDRIDIMPISEHYYDRLKQEGQPVQMVAVLSAQPIGIACQKEFPDTLLHEMQTALDTLIADGTQKKIFEQYGMQLEN
jgi:polar amino acid transport system substrate-binding protein